MAKVVNFKDFIECKEYNNLTDFQKLLIETAFEFDKQGIHPQGFCLITQSNMQVGGACSSVSGIADMCLEEIEGYIGKLVIQIRMATDRAAKLYMEED